MRYNGRRLTNKDYLAYWGKWVFLGEKEELDVMAEKLDPYVENGEIPCIKYDRSPQKWFDLEQCVMCVYCDKRQRDKVFNILAKFGVKGKRWVPESEVIDKWKPGGLNLERWLEFHDLKGEKADKIRKKIKNQLEIFFKRPNEICLGWQQ
jgi:hypothetical protein